MERNENSKRACTASLEGRITSCDLCYCFREDLKEPGVLGVPILLTLMALLWPELQLASRRRAFRKLILRELEEVTPFPPLAQSNGEWFQHLPKNFVHQAIFMTASAHRDFILSLPPDLVYDVYQLWDALKSRNQVQWLTFLCKLANPSFDRHGEIRKAHLQWLHLIDQDEELAQNSRNGAEARLKDANGRQRKNSIRKQAKRPAESHSPVSATEAVTRQRHTRPSGRQSTKRRTRE